MITSGKEYMPLVDVSFLSALNLVLSANKGSAESPIKLFFMHETTSSYLIPISFITFLKQSGSNTVVFFKQSSLNFTI